jgi:hypothetical protein
VSNSITLLLLRRLSCAWLVLCSFQALIFHRANTFLQIEEGNIFATINQRDGMVSFKEDPEQYNTNEMLTKVDRHISKSLELSNRIKTLDEAISLTTHYVQRTNTQERTTRAWNEMDELMAEKMSYNW